MNIRVLGIIPARGGSKGVTRKNVRKVAGKPLIQWTIEAATRSKLLTDFYVSTDSAEIAAVAKSCGSKVFIRPMDLAQDNTPMIPSVQHALSEAENINGKYDYFILLQPTAPQRTYMDIDNSISILNKNKGIDSVISVYQVEDNHPSRMYTQKKGLLQKYAEEPEGALRQDLDKVYLRNGAIYLCRRDLLVLRGALIGSRCAAYEMSKECSSNIDDEIDLDIASLMLKIQYNIES